jgi:hypothetical protein
MLVPRIVSETEDQVSPIPGSMLGLHKRGLWVALANSAAYRPRGSALGGGYLLMHAESPLGLAAEKLLVETHQGIDAMSVAAYIFPALFSSASEN